MDEAEAGECNVIGVGGIDLEAFGELVKGPLPAPCQPVSTLALLATFSTSEKVMPPSVLLETMGTLVL